MKMTREPNDIELILNESVQGQANEHKTILKTQLNDHTVLFTLFGREIDECIANATWRAIEQNTTADIFTEQVFKDIFKPETKPKFKTLLYAKDELDIQKLQKEYPDKIDTQVLKRIIESKDKQYFKAEIDGIITVGLAQPQLIKGVLFDFKTMFIEVKLFTCPFDDPYRSVKKHLQNQKLEEYFELRNILGLLTFSYLHREEESLPAAVYTEDFKDRTPPNSWGIHFVLIGKEILEDGLDAPQRIERIFEGIKTHQQIMKEANNLPDNYKYSIIYNIITVVNMAHMIAELKNQIKLEQVAKEKERQEKEKERQEKEKERQEKEKERQEKEKERQEKERLKKLLEKYKQKFGNLPSEE